MKEKEALGYIRGACLGLKTLHSLGTAHGYVSNKRIFRERIAKIEIKIFDIKNALSNCFVVI